MTERVVFMHEIFRNDDLKHEIPLGQVVEVEFDGHSPWNIFYSNGKEVYDGPRYDCEKHKHVTPPAEYKEVCLGFTGNVKAIVVGHHRDCDGTPLYAVASDPIGYSDGGIAQNLEYRRWAKFLEHGFSAESLKVCVGQFIPIKYRDIMEFKRSMLSELRTPTE